MEKPFKCPYCRSTQTTWKGYRQLVKGRVRLRKMQKMRKEIHSQGEK